MPVAKLESDADAIDEIAAGLAYVKGLVGGSDPEGSARLDRQVTNLHECSAFCRDLSALVAEDG